VLHVERLVSACLRPFPLKPGKRQCQSWRKAPRKYLEQDKAQTSPGNPEREPPRVARSQLTEPDQATQDAAGDERPSGEQQAVALSLEVHIVAIVLRVARNSRGRPWRVPDCNSLCSAGKRTDEGTGLLRPMSRPRNIQAVNGTVCLWNQGTPIQTTCSPYTILISKLEDFDRLLQ